MSFPAGQVPYARIGEWMSVTTEGAAYSGESLIGGKVNYDVKVEPWAYVPPGNTWYTMPVLLEGRLRYRYSGMPVIRRPIRSKGS
jgi:hypothetical protein